MPAYECGIFVFFGLSSGNSCNAVGDYDSEYDSYHARRESCDRFTRNTSSRNSERMPTPIRLEPQSPPYR